MHLHRSISLAIRTDQTWHERWKGPDSGIIASWERGREMSRERPDLAQRASNGELVILPWKGGVEKKLKAKRKYGTLCYLAMWQGLRGSDLDIDMGQEATLVCSKTEMSVTYTPDSTKYANDSGGSVT
jgi:hypothetical protein